MATWGFYLWAHLSGSSVCMSCRWNFRDDSSLRAFPGELRALGPSLPNLAQSQGVGCGTR